MSSGVPRRVCFYSVATHLGGGERSVLELMKGLKARPELGYEPWALLPKEDGPLVDQLARHGIDHDVLRLPASFFKMSRGAPLSAFQLGLRSIPGMGFYLARLGALLRKRRPALVHTNAIKCHALAAVAGPVLGVPVLWHLRDILGDGPTLWTLRALGAAAGARTSHGRIRVIANSRATAEAFASEAGISVIHNGLDPDVYRRAPNRSFNELLGAPAAAPVVGIVGVLARWKGQLEFLRMAERLVRQGSSARFVVIGGEIYDTAGERGFTHSLREEAKRLGILDRVLFAGFRDDPVEAINGLDVLVHASTRPEPFGRVVIEGMACGVPVAASAGGGVLEIVEDGRNGLLFPPGDVGAMAEAVSRLLAEPPLRMALAERGRADFLARFTHGRHVEAVAGVYGEMLASRASSR